MPSTWPARYRWHWRSCRFDRLTARPTTRPVEDLLTRDAAMAVFELLWLLLFAAGLLELGQLFH